MSSTATETETRLDPERETVDSSGTAAEQTSPAEPESSQDTNGSTPSSPWKYRIIKAIDVSGLTFLTPVIRLCFREEPGKQFREITRFIIVPIVAFCLFLGAWSVLAPRHKTRSGEVPTPAVVLDAAGSIWTFHVREGSKNEAYQLSGKTRDDQLKRVQIRSQQLKEMRTKADADVAAAVSDAEAKRQGIVAPMLEELEAKTKDATAAEEKRVTALKSAGETLPPNDRDAANQFLNDVRDHLELSKAAEESLQEFRAGIDDELSEDFPEVVAALAVQNSVAEEQQFMKAMQDQLTSANQSVKVEASKAQLKKKESAFLGSLGTETAFDSAVAVVNGHERLQMAKDAEYAKPWTLPRQTFRSVACVFVGFLLGTMIAIPIGILCGLSKTFMAAVTPFIALFKPVSPIVWLPIALIIVGGFIEDPDKHWLIQGLAELPVIGWMKINPAFMACAVTVALCSLWATMVNTAFGVASIEQDHLNVASVLHLGFKDRLFKVIIPSALPLIFAGMRISLGVGWMVLIAAELLSSSEGIGKFVWDQFMNGAQDSFAKMFVVVFVVGMIGMVLDRMMIVLQRLVTFDGATTSI